MRGRVELFPLAMFVRRLDTAGIGRWAKIRRGAQSFLRVAHTRAVYRFLCLNLRRAPAVTAHPGRGVGFPLDITISALGGWWVVRISGSFLIWGPISINTDECNVENTAAGIDPPHT